MAARKRTPTIEARILAALRRAGRPMSVTQLHGPGMPGLTSRTVAEIRAACEAMAARGELTAVRVVGVTPMVVSHDA